MSSLRFLKSAAQITDFPDDEVPELAFAGRSNAGKSSLINLLANSRIAKVSGTPGKTRLLNLFDHRSGFRIVDMPGYGYAARSGSEMKSWGKMIEQYLRQRPNLAGIVLVMDIRRDWSEDEALLLEMAHSQEIDFYLVITKMDKLSRGRAMSARQKLIHTIGSKLVFPVSTLKREGHKVFEEALIQKYGPEE